MLRLPSDPQARRFALSVLVAFLPAAVLGFLFHDDIKRILFDSPSAQCIALIVGSVILLFIDRVVPSPTRHDPMKLQLRTAFAIGLFQCAGCWPSSPSAASRRSAGSGSRSELSVLRCCREPSGMTQVGWA